MLSPYTATSDDASKHTGSKPKFNHITSDNLTLRLAETEAEILAAQQLRYEVFYKELGAHPVGDTAAKEREFEFYDDYCDHLIVIDNTDNKVVGTYRILLGKTAEEKNIPLYTATEFDISKLKATGGKIMEISRSCVKETHRSKSAINLLWKGIATVVFANEIDYLIGTPSFPGLDLENEKQALAYLNAYHAADESIRPRVYEEFYNPLPIVNKESIDAKRAFMALPPLLKGYLRIGSVVADGAFIDRQFNCIDIAVVLPINGVTDRYFNHYKRADAE